MAEITVRHRAGCANAANTFATEMPIHTIARKDVLGGSTQRNARITDCGAHSVGTARVRMYDVVLSLYSRMWTTRQSPMVGTYISSLARGPVFDLSAFAALSIFAFGRQQAACILPQSDRMVSPPIGEPVEEGCR